MKHGDLVGRQFGFVYSDETFLIEILSEESLRWTREVGKDMGRSDTEHYVYSSIAADVIMLTWVEADGLGLSNVLRLSDNALVTHAKVGREVFVNAGTVLVR